MIGDESGIRLRREREREDGLPGRVLVLPRVLDEAPLLAGGVRYLGGTLESFGNSSAADSLLAIKQVVYEKKLLTMEQLVECLKSNFEGHERERQLLRSVTKFGNDDAEADRMSTWLNTMVCQASRRQAQLVGDRHLGGCGQTTGPAQGVGQYCHRASTLQCQRGRDQVGRGRQDVGDHRRRRVP